MKPFEASEVGKRLKETRLALGMSQREFAGSAGIKASTYSQAESGAQRLGLDSAIAIALRHGISLNWIYLGDNSNLRLDVAEKIRAMHQRAPLTNGIIPKKRPVSLPKSKL